MSKWTNHLLDLAELETNIGKRIAFETSAKKIDELEAENQALRNELEVLKGTTMGVDLSKDYINKIKADTIKEIAEANKCELNIPSYPEDVVVCYFDDLMGDANKLGQDND